MPGSIELYVPKATLKPMLLLSSLSESNPFSERTPRALRRRSAFANRIRDNRGEIEASGEYLEEFFRRPLQTSPIEDERFGAAHARRDERSIRTEHNCESILKMTAEMFPKAKITFSKESDPEIEDDDYLAILVETPGTVDEVVALHREWHNRIGRLAPETANFYRLLLDIND